MGVGGDALLSACARIRRRRNGRPSQRRVGCAAAGSPHSADRRGDDSGAALNPAARAHAGAAMGVRRAADAILCRGRLVGGHTICAVRAGAAGGGVGWDAGVVGLLKFKFGYQLVSVKMYNMYNIADSRDSNTWEKVA